MDGMVDVTQLQKKIIKNALHVYSLTIKQSMQHSINHGVIPVGVSTYGTEAIDALLKIFDSKDKEKEENKGAESK